MDGNGDVVTTPRSGALETATGGIVTHARHGDGSESLRAADALQSAAADSSPGAPLECTLEGKNRHQEEGVRDVCWILLQHLARHGRVYAGLREVKDEDFPGVDCIAEGASGMLKMQVTRAIGGDFREGLALDGGVSHTYANADEAADAICDAIQGKRGKLEQRKPTIDLGEITLVLDSRETLETLHLILGDDVVASFRSRHARCCLGFQAVYLVGPAVAYVFPLGS